VKVGDLVRVEGLGLHIITGAWGLHVSLSGFAENQVFLKTDCEVINEAR